MSLLQTYVLWPGLALAGFAFCFGLVERLWPAVAGQHRWRRGTGIDLVFSFLNPLVVTPLTSLAITAVVNAVLRRAGYEYLDAAQTAVGAWPFWLQLVAGLVVADFFSYWKHRAFHTGPLWPIHAVHHSAEEVDWLTNERDHPLQLLATHVAVVVPLVLAGFSPELIALQATLRRAYSLYTHANVRWSYGGLGRVFVSPAFHRWHHAGDAEMAGKNFAVFFSAFDVIFGTYRVPAGEQRPQTFGLPGGESLRDLVSMLLYPWRAYAARLTPRRLRPAPQR